MAFPNRTELWDFNVKVPTGRFTAFYIMFGRWRTGAETPTGERAVASTGGPEPARTPWLAEDGARAGVVWAKLSDLAKELFSIMIDAPNREFDGEALAEKLSLTTGRHGVSGLLAWPSRHAASVGRSIFWNCLVGPDGPTGTCEYSMSEEQADLFRAARDGDSTRRAGL
jgi:hypothetical protein